MTLEISVMSAVTKRWHVTVTPVWWSDSDPYDIFYRVLYGDHMISPELLPVQDPPHLAQILSRDMFSQEPLHTHQLAGHGDHNDS